MLLSVIIISSNSFQLHYDNLIASVRCRLRPVKKRLKRKKSNKDLWRRKKKKRKRKGKPLPYTAGALCMVWMWCFIFRKYQKNKSNGNCFYVTGKKRWMVNCFCSFQPLKPVFPMRPHMYDYSHLNRAVNQCIIHCLPRTIQSIIGIKAEE